MKRLIISGIMMGLVSLVMIATGFGLINPVPVLAQTDAPNITLITPSAGEICEAGTQQNITWTTTRAGVGKVRLYFKDYMDKNWYPIVSTENTGVYTWNLPYVDSKHLQVQAIWEYYDDDNLKVKLLETEDISEEFSIYIRNSKRDITITSPSAADKIWNSESRQTIKWSFDKGVGGVTALAYRQGPNEKWIPIDMVENGTQYIWTVPPIATKQAQIRVTWQSVKEDYATIYATSVSDSFTIESIYAQSQLSPTAPASLSAEVDASSKMQLFWTDKSNDEEGFKIERRKESGDFSQVAVLDSDKVTYTESGLIPGNTYAYRVRAYNQGGNSAYSNVAYVFIPKYNTNNTLRFVIGQPNYSINGEQREMDIAPIITEGRTLLPIRYVTEPLGAVLDWEPVEKKVTIRIAGTNIELWVDKNTARVNGQERFIDPLNSKVVPIISASGRVMLPVRFITENLGYQIAWNQVTQTLTIVSPIQ